MAVKTASKAKSSKPARRPVRRTPALRTRGAAPSAKLLSNPEFALSALNEAIGLIAKESGQLADKSVAVLAAHYVQVRWASEKLEEASKALNAIRDKLKTETVPAAFEREGVTSFTLEKGFRVGVSSRVFASILADVKPKAYEWLRSNQLGDLITETVNASTLSAAAKKRMEDGFDMPEDLFKVALVPTTSVTAVK